MCLCCIKGQPQVSPDGENRIARKGREKNIATPANDAIVELCRRIERGELKPDKSNVDIILKLMG